MLLELLGQRKEEKDKKRYGDWKLGVVKQAERKCQTRAVWGVRTCPPPPSIRRTTLSPEQQEMALELKEQRILQSEAYLATHPQADALVSMLLRAMLIRRPANPKQFAKKFFSDPNIGKLLNAYLKEHKIWNLSPFLSRKRKSGFKNGTRPLKQDCVSQPGCDEYLRTNTEEPVTVGPFFENANFNLRLQCVENDSNATLPPAGASEVLPYRDDDSDLTWSEDELVSPSSEESDSCGLNDFDSLTEVCKVNARWDI